MIVRDNRLARRESMTEDSAHADAARCRRSAEERDRVAQLLLHREDAHATELQQHVAELIAARNGLKEQVLRNEQLKLRLARLLRERFGASSEKLRGEIEQLELLLGEFRGAGSGSNAA